MWTCSRLPHLSVICVSTQLQTAALLALPNRWGLHMKQMNHSLTYSGCYQLMHLDAHIHTHACTYPRTHRNTDQSPAFHSPPIWYQSCHLFPTASRIFFQPSSFILMPLSLGIAFYQPPCCGRLAVTNLSIGIETKIHNRMSAWPVHIIWVVRSILNVNNGESCFDLSFINQSSCQWEAANFPASSISYSPALVPLYKNMLANIAIVSLIKNWYLEQIPLCGLFISSWHLQHAYGKNMPTNLSDLKIWQ